MALSVEMSAEDSLSAALAERFLATLGYDDPKLGAGDIAPWGIHWCIAPEAPPLSALGLDGLPGEGSVLSSLPLPFRMWAGATVEFPADGLKIGDAVTRRSFVGDMREKTGVAGRLVFLDAINEFLVDGVCRLRETQTFVCREHQPSASTGEIAQPLSGRELRHILPDQAMLLRFSALSFNTHRIHYDLPYTRDVEGHRALLVQGTLTASLMLEALRRDGVKPPFRAAIRALSPAYCDEPLALLVEGETSLTARSPAGRAVMTCRWT